ncbi:MAG TPA: tetratricopeptide repeat protein [Ktedonobacteraceae bacterium]|nr:tetratricopeptide repeat protein [Ktedonobacteraceae bacterium]
MKKAAQSIPNQRLSHAREQRGWSQQEVADRIGTTSVNISRWERGLTAPGPYFRHKLCALFEQSPQELGLIQETAGDPLAQASKPTPSGQIVPLISEGSRLWNIPYRRNPFFTGREDVIQRIHAALLANRTVAMTQTQAITGLGGIGKTQTVLEYAYRYRDEYQALLWVRADTRETLISDFTAIAELLHLPEQHEQDQSRVVQSVRRWLNNHQGWLLILDNVEDVQMIVDFLPDTGNGHILLTTRAQALGTVAERIDLELMDAGEGALLLLRRAGIIGREAPLDSMTYAYWEKAQKIARLMDGLPLALDQAAAYIEETACGLSGYLERYQTHRRQLMKRRGRACATHPEPVTTTWSLAFAKVGQANAAAAELLRLCAFLHPDAIPEEIIVQGAPELGPILEAVGSDPLKVDDAILQLRTFSLIHRDPQTRILSLHRLVQAVLKDQMDAQTERLWAERTVRAVNRAFPEVDYTTWQQCQRCLPHARMCQQLIAQWQIHTPQAAQLLHKAGAYLRDREQYEEAASLLRQALAMREQLFGTIHPDVAQSAHQLASLYWLRGQFEQAEPFFLQAIAIRRQTLGPDHPAVADCLNDLALLYGNQGRYEQAEALYHQALSLYERDPQADSRALANCLNNLAVLYHFEGKYGQAEPLLLRALDIWERRSGSAHPDMTFVLHDLGYQYYRTGKYEQAEAFFRRALTMREQTMGTEHSETAYTLDNLALVYIEQGKYEQAEPLLQRALAIREQALGPEHSYVGQTLNHLGLLFYHQGRYSQAEALLGRSLAIRERALGTAHPDVASTLYTLARVYSAQRKYVQAEPLFQRTLAIWEQAYGGAHPDIKSCLRHYADLLRQTKRSSEAEALEERAAAMHL